MAKEWFVFQKDHHEGPFSSEEMEELFRAGQIKETDPVWREGQEDWEPLNSQAPLRRLLIKGGHASRQPVPPPPPLPPLPSIPPSTADVPVAPSAVEAKVRVSGRRRFGSICLILATLSLVGSGAWLYTRRFGPPSAPPTLDGVSEQEAEQLGQLPTLATDGHKIVLSQDGSSLWLAFGHPLTGTAELDLRSRQERILADHSVEATSSGRIAAGLVRFSDFELLRGDRLFPGEYDYRIRLYPDGILKSLGEILEVQSPWLYRRVGFLLGSFVLEGMIGYYGMSHEEFRERLDNVNRDRNFQQKGLPLIDQLEKLKVFFSMMEKIEEVFKRNLPKATKGEDFKALEDHYVRNISPLLQKMILDSHRQAVQLMDSQMSMSTEHLEIFESGKAVAQFVSHIIEMTVNVDEYTPEIRKDVDGRFRKDYDEVLLKLNALLEKKKKQSEEFLDN